MSKITAQIIAEHGLSEAEYQLALQILGKEPNITELGIISVMWSEHCSYKSSKRWLKTLPTTAPWVICGPGENAGVIDIGDNQVAIFKIESHNHPSFIEPYQGAATGVGGIMRDVFTMGARPIAMLNALRFGATSHHKTAHLLNGVVAGIGDYGNCMGVPTVAGETNFDQAYNNNILVNAMCVGIAKADKVFYSSASGVGNPVLYVGAKTGRDGIHGATMASAEFKEGEEEKRPTVQVGDPFTEKRLLEACLELMATDAIIAIQDMGAAGLTSSSVEMASKGDVGITLYLEKVPQRETGMTAYEMMLSESQERMLMVIKPERRELASQIFQKWQLDCVEIGEVSDSKRLIIKHHGQIAADIPVAPLVSASPEYDRPWVKPTMPALEQQQITYDDTLIKTYISKVLHQAKNIDAIDSDIADVVDVNCWIKSQFDSQVGGNTVADKHLDAGVIRVNEATGKALAMSVDCTPRYCLNNPYEGGKQAVAESYRNLIAARAQPLAITNNLNFANPEKPEVMGQMVEAIRGIKDACLALSYPVVSGNVSLYNETDGIGIMPTPVIGGVGIIDDYASVRKFDTIKAGYHLYEVGGTGSHLGASLWASVILADYNQAPPIIDLAKELKVGQTVLQFLQQHEAAVCHDISDGGLIVAIDEMLRVNNLEVNFTSAETTATLFGEDQARYVIAMPTLQPNIAQFVSLGVEYRYIGIVQNRH
jgi:phosphoribosylformylglycinamidine synthase